MTKAIGFIGIGIMGSHIASHLVKKYKSIHIMGRSSKKTKKFISEHKDKLFVYDRLDNLANNCNYIITCVGNDKDLRSVFLSKKSDVGFSKILFIVF